MGSVIGLAPCLACGRIFAFDPDLVPSLRYPPPDGPREPLCLACVKRAGPDRASNGLPPIEVLPGAYFDE